MVAERASRERGVSMTEWIRGDLADVSPEAPGWYAELVIWDEEEGICSLVRHWDGKRWNDWTNGFIVARSREPFATEAEADDAALDKSLEY